MPNCQCSPIEWPVLLGTAYLLLTCENSENYIFTFFKILNCKNTSRFENFAKIPPCRQLLGRQGACRPSTWRQGSKCKIATGKFESRAGAGTCRPSTWRQAPCRQLIGR